MWKYLNRGISAPIAIGIIFILTILVAGFTCWQYEEIREEEYNVLEVQIPEKRETAGSSSEFLTTESWNIYRNEEYGFEIRYPKDWTVENQGTYLLFYNPEEQNIYPVQISFLENPKQLSVKEWVEDKISLHVISSIGLISEKNINGTMVIRLTESGRVRLPQGDLTEGWFEKESVYALQGTTIYNLITVTNHEYFNQMLSTFRFIK